MKLRLLPDSAKVTAIIVWTLRILVGTVFIYSGFAKAVDPWGGMYKFAEYFAVWQMQFPRELILMLASALAIFEFALGVALLLGCFRRTSAWFLGIFMLVMTPLTLYIYIQDPVSDCGCFGDALILSNGATFAKNILLSICAVYLILLNDKVRGLVTMKLQWISATASVIYGSLLSFISYNDQPLVDFRPYPIGEVVGRVDADPVDTQGMTFIYEKDGVQKEFDADHIPEDESWTFVERKVPEMPVGEDDFVVLDVDGEDATEEAIPAKGKSLLMIISNPQRVGLSRSRMAYELAEAMGKNDGHFAAVIASDYPGGIEAWSKKVHAANYNVYQAEDTDLKIIARGDIALIYLRDGQIVWKHNAYNFSPDFGQQIMQSPETLDNIEATENSGKLMTLSVMLLLVQLLLVALAPLLTYIRKKRTVPKSQPEPEPAKN